jgi:tellurite resistance protein TerC
VIFPIWAWGAFTALVVAMLALDLLVLHRDAQQVSLRQAAAWSAVWVLLVLAFGGLLLAWRGGATAQAYLTAYLIEKSLSVDNVFVYALIFAMFSIPARHQHRVLMYGIIGALIMRGAFIAGGAALLDSFHIAVYSVIPSAGQLHGQKFVVRQGGRRVATPLLTALLLIETTDVIFATDSIPAVSTWHHPGRRRDQDAAQRPV